MRFLAAAMQCQDFRFVWLPVCCNGSETGKMVSLLREAPNVSVGTDGTSLDVASTLHQQAAPVPLAPVHVANGLHQRSTSLPAKPLWYSTHDWGRGLSADTEVTTACSRQQFAWASLTVPPLPLLCSGQQRGPPRAQSRCESEVQLCSREQQGERDTGQAASS